MKRDGRHFCEPEHNNPHRRNTHTHKTYPAHRKQRHKTTKFLAHPPHQRIENFNIRPITSHQVHYISRLSEILLVARTFSVDAEKWRANFSTENILKLLEIVVETGAYLDILEL
jgi:hypothetical protein